MAKGVYEHLKYARARANSMDADEVERGSLLGRGCEHRHSSRFHTFLGGIYRSQGSQ